jgi:putative FmdB family regulatory protein
MPTYEYACDPCRTIYQTQHGMNDPRPETCQECGAALRRVFSPPLLNLDRFTSPTEAKYKNVSASEEVVKETELQKVYRTVWLPPPVKHSPWDDH